MASSDRPLTGAKRLGPKSDIPDTSLDLQSKPSNLKYGGDTGDHTRALSVRDEKQPRDSIAKDAPEDIFEYPEGFALAFIVFAICLTIFLPSLDMTIVATAIPKITDEFRGLDKVSWYGSAFFMTNGGFQSSWGKAYRYFSLKSTFLIAVLVLEIGSLICALSQNSTSLIVGRAVTGLGAAGLATGSYTIVAFIVEPEKRPTYTGIMGMCYGIASVAGPLLGGVLSDKVSWRWCFWINLPVGGVSALIMFLVFRTPSHAKPVKAGWKEILQQMDFVGVGMIMSAIVTYILALQYGGQSDAWSSAKVIGLLVGFVAILIAFIIWEKFQGERAMVVPRLFKTRNVGISCAYTYFFSGPYFLIIYYLPIYFQSVYNATPTMSGVYNFPLILMFTITMICSGIFVTATGHAVPLKVCAAAITTIACGLLYTLDVDTSMAKWIGYQILGAFGWGIGTQLPINVSQNNTDPSDISTITAMVLFFQCGGGTSFVTAAQAAFVNKLITTLPTTAPGVDSAVVIATGATDIRTAFPRDQVAGIVEAYMAGIKAAFAIPVAASGIALIVSLFSKWKRLNEGAAKASSVA